MIAAPIVSPRVHSSAAGGKVLLTDEIELIMSLREHAVIRLDGVGKSTAIQFLRDWFAGSLGLIFDDQQSPLDLSEFQAFVITTRPSTKSDIVLMLAGWDRDEIIDYLLAKDPTACQSVLSRLDDSSYQFCEGSPEVWAFILDQMLAGANDKPLGEIALELLKLTIAEGIKRWDGETPVFSEFRKVQPICGQLFNSFTNLTTDQALASVQVYVRGDGTRRLLRHPEIRNQLIGDEMARRLQCHDSSALANPVPPKALAICARQIENAASTMTFLQTAFDKGQYAGAAASLLLFCDASWKPKKLSKRLLMKVHLDGARWDGIKLIGCSLAMASVRRCQLRKANLRESSLVGADFADSDLGGAVLMKVKANHANFSNCILSGIIGPDSSWPHAILLNANLDEAKLASADFDDAVLNNASLVRCDLSRASFYRALLDRADFSFANCLGADFSHCDLRTAIFFEANCNHASFDESNLEELDLHSIDMSDARCHKTLFSGSRMRQANLQRVQLHGANG